MIKRCLVVLALAGRVAVAQSEPPTPELLDENKAMWLTVGGTVGAYTLFGGAIAAEDWLPTEVGVPLVVVTLTGTLLAPSFGPRAIRRSSRRGSDLRAADGAARTPPHGRGSRTGASALRGSERAVHRTRRDRAQSSGRAADAPTSPRAADVTHLVPARERRMTRPTSPWRRHW